MYIKLTVSSSRSFKLLANLSARLLHHYNILKHNLTVWQQYTKRVLDLLYGKGVKYLFSVDKTRSFNEKPRELANKTSFLPSRFGSVSISHIDKVTWFPVAGYPEDGVINKANI